MSLHTGTRTVPSITSPPSPPSPPSRGLVNVFLSRWQQARESFEAALHLEPTNLILRNNIAVCAFYQGHLKEVRE